METRKSGWRRWFNRKNLTPILTIVAGAVILLLLLLDMLPANGAENAVIPLLMLLAADALIERVGILEELSDKVERISAKSGLRTRRDIELESRFSEARRISIVAISGVNLIRERLGLFEDFLKKSNTQLRFILVNPESSALDYHMMLDDPTERPPRANIEYATKMVRELGKAAARNGSTCELAYLDCVLPYSMILVERSGITDIMWVEFHSYKSRDYTTRPNIMLRRGDEGVWFEFYEKQFNQAWDDATVVDLRAESES
ncbi:MAG: hypothetical protein H6671_18600 [Anaerolineaceae bacterium]|nr:hypothetical protein [Anaerolineaceae bacterium]MCB9457996.1 hypothetical protein [Anaerolineaceae bacterium]